jgi:[acyl-carrier-protein] S-malonyltransferase
MSSLAFVFPGQGSQAVGMGRALAAVSPAAAAVFVQADEALGEPLSRLAWAGPADELDLTENAQPALLATSIVPAAARDAAAPGCARRTRRSSPATDGSVPAMVAAGTSTIADGVRLP